MTAIDDLIRRLRRQGVTPAGELVEQLGISAATLSRWTRSSDGRIMRIGKTRGARYALHDPIDAIGAQWPVWMIDSQGQPHRRGQLHCLHGPASYWETEPGRGIFYDGIPPFIADMAPQGFLGQLFSRRYPELDLPPRIRDWQHDHLFQALVLRGDDTPGNLIVGEPAMDRFLQRQITPTAPSDYPAITRLLIRQGSGSSAAGEYPKFTAYDGTHHLIVKFTAGDGSPADQRWQDLLRCEAHAAATLKDTQADAAETRPITEGKQLFLEIRRFDREGERGRHPVITLGAVDDAWFGRRDDWIRAAKRLTDKGWINEETQQQILLLEAFGRLIHNNDRHFGNLAFHWQPDASEPSLSLTPAFDMLPMAFAPAANGMLPSHQTEPATPTAALLDVWPPAHALARQFRDRVGDDQSISPEFRQAIAQSIAG